MNNEVLTEFEVSEYLRLSIHTLRKWRQTDQGFPYVKMGKFVRYQRKDIETYMDDKTINASQ